MTFDALSDLNWLAVLVAASRVLRDRRALVRAAGLRKDVDGGRRHGDTRRPGPPEPRDLPDAAGRERALRDRPRDVAKTTGTETLQQGIVLGLVVAIGFAVSITFVTAQFESEKPKPMVWAAITAGYHAVGSWSPRSSSRAGSRAG